MLVENSQITFRLLSAAAAVGGTSIFHLWRTTTFLVLTQGNICNLHIFYTFSSLLHWKIILNSYFCDSEVGNTHQYESCACLWKQWDNNQVVRLPVHSFQNIRSVFSLSYMINPSHITVSTVWYEHDTTPIHLTTLSYPLGHIFKFHQSLSVFAWSDNFHGWWRISFHIQTLAQQQYV